MDTWWKRVVYSSVLKKFAVIVMFVAGFIMAMSFIGINSLPSQGNYFESYEFTGLFISKAGYLRDWIVRYDESKIFTEVTPEEINEYIIKDGRDITKEEAIQGIITDRKNYYTTIQNELKATNKNLDYLAIDTNSGRYVTNMMEGNVQDNIDELTNRSNYLIGNGYYILNFKYGTDSIDNYYSDRYINSGSYYTGEKFEGQDNYRIYIALKEELIPGDEFYVGYKEFEMNRIRQIQLYDMGIGALIVGGIFFVYWMIVVGRNGRDKEIVLNSFDSIPLEIQILIGIICSILFVAAINIYVDVIGISSILSFYSKGIQYNVASLVPLFLISTFGIGMGLLLISSWVKHFKRGSALEHVGVYRICKSVYRSVDNKAKMFVLLGGIITVSSIVDTFFIFMLDYYSDVVVITWALIWNVLCGVIVLKFILDYKTILQGARAITNGELDKKVELSVTLPILKEMAETINSMGTGLEKAVGESIKSERLKTELITNVSHDLKTPLTSIISYIDLLKGETIENETAMEYIGVLDERSHRLKQLVEDLVEASKAVTGNLKANPEILRLDELVGQAIGEYSDRIEDNALTLMSDKIGEVRVLADGRHMWRIIENLLSNVCKYAMPQTRVYVEVYEEKNAGYCTIKNISKDPLNIDPNELTQRFVRGDASRTTEGSGLGLAIAQSLAKIQGGQLDISIDGDLFKVTVKVPLAPSPSITLTKEEK